MGSKQGLFRIFNVFSGHKLLINSSRNASPLFRSIVRNKSLEEIVGLPAKPKRPLTPYFRFLKQIRPSIAEKNPEANVQTVTRIIAQHWEKIEPKAKEILEAEYKKDQEIYMMEKLKYDSKLTKEDRVKLQEARRDREVDREKREQKKRRKDLQKPKKAGSPFVIWMQTQMVNRGETPFREYLSKLGQTWKTLPDEEKEQYRAEARMQSEKYRESMALWEEKMIRLGNIDMVRGESLLEPRKSKEKKVVSKKPE